MSSSTAVRVRLGEWHTKQIENLKIDLEGDRAQKGILEGIPGLIVERWKYVSTKPGLDFDIESQSHLSLESRGQIEEVFEKDVQVIMKDGKYYYLREDTE